ncbi:hypothetical protein ABZ780_01800 [Micromonospora sp. NPDC047467]|uniref:hypothetical protein n=1 Tax=Micromonospora sp. NPDC047467 TaxID=3154814 RepID=UPI0033E4C6B7
MCDTSPLNSLQDIFELIINPVGMFVRIIANLILAGAISIFGELTDEVPTLSAEADGEPSMAVPGMISDQIEWLIVYLAVGSILFAAAKMAMDRRAEAGKVALRGFLRVILVAGAGSWIAIKAAAISDDYTRHLFSTASLNIIKSVPCIDDGSGMEAFLLLVLAFLLLISAIVHVLLLYVRLGVMILLLGTLPLAAAASMTNWGAGWWRKHIGWTVAWLLYKPAVGLIMYAGSQMIAQGNKSEDGIHSRIAGVGVLLLSAIALPALLKLVVPATAALGTGDPAGTAISAAGGAIASGAKKIASGAASSSGGSVGPSGSRAPSGASGPAGRDGGSASGGRDGASGRNGAGGRPAPSSAGAATSGAGAAASAAGPAAAVIGATYQAAQVGRRMVSGAVERADGDAGHN